MRIPGDGGGSLLVDVERVHGDIWINVDGDGTALLAVAAGDLVGGGVLDGDGSTTVWNTVYGTARVTVAVPGDGDGSPTVDGGGVDGEGWWGWGVVATVVEVTVAEVAGVVAVREVTGDGGTHTVFGPLAGVCPASPSGAAAAGVERWVADEAGVAGVVVAALIAANCTNTNHRPRC